LRAFKWHQSERHFCIVPVAGGTIAALAGAGLLHAERSFPVYAGLAVVVSLMSIGLGVLYLLGLDILPGIFT
jgi:hypothetical protein